MSLPEIDDNDIALVVQTLQSKCLSMGPFLDRLEQLFAEYLGVGHAVGVSSGTAALHLCIRAADIGEGDEVITTPFSFVASSNCILYERAKPVFVDVDEDSMNIDPHLARQAVTERTRAIVPVHVFGQPCKMDELDALCRERDLVLIEDACEALGAEFKGRKVGSFGKAAAFGFYPNKQMTMGEGGLIATNDADWAAMLRSLRNHGRTEMGVALHHERLGFNYRLDEMSAALGFSQLSRFEELLRRRSEAAKIYRQLLKDVPGVNILSPPEKEMRMSWFVFIIRLDENISRDRVIAELHHYGIPTRTYFSPIHLQPFYKEMFGYREGDFPITERIAKSVLALPFYSNIPVGEIEYIVNCLKAAVEPLVV
jgi:dTDP-4-amino-4,6-dideoxygalactose transaminase